MTLQHFTLTLLKNLERNVDVENWNSFIPSLHDSLDSEVLLEDPVAEEDDLDAARGRHGVGAEVGDGKRAELLPVAYDARDHGLQHLWRPPRLRQEHLQLYIQRVISCCLRHKEIAKFCLKWHAEV